MFFSKTAQTIFLDFGLKLILNMTFNLNETYFSDIFAISRWPRFVKKLPKLRFLAIVLTLHHWFSLILHIMIGGHDFQLFSYNLPVQLMYSCFLYYRSRFNSNIIFNKQVQGVEQRFQSMREGMAGIITFWRAITKVRCSDFKLSHRLVKLNR